ncbi:hypothetical protein Bca4012_074672 [Brassica carinata]
MAVTEDLDDGEVDVVVKETRQKRMRPNRLFVFGDSYADTGNIRKSLADSWKMPYGVSFPGKPSGRFSDGRIATDFLARYLGIKSPIPYTWKNYAGKERLLFGMNYAYGGTGVFKTFNNPLPNMTTQIDYFQKVLASGNIYTPSDLHTSLALVSNAGNDYGTFILQKRLMTLGGKGGTAVLSATRVRALATTDLTSLPLGRWTPFGDSWKRGCPDTREFPGFIKQVVDQTEVNLRRIHKLGVKKIAIASLQPLGCLPSKTTSSSFKHCNASDNALVKLHNILLRRAVAKLNNETKPSTFVILDLYKAFLTVLKNKRAKTESFKSSSLVQISTRAAGPI